MLDQVFDDFKVAVEAGGPERRRVGLGGAVDGGAAADQETDDGHVTGGGGHPQRRRPFDRFAIESHCRHSQTSQHVRPLDNFFAQLITDRWRNSAMRLCATSFLGPPTRKRLRRIRSRDLQFSVLDVEILRVCTQNCRLVRDFGPIFCLQLRI